MIDQRTAGSIIVPTYANGEYFATHDLPDRDASFKADAFLKLFRPVCFDRKYMIRSYADVGCGSGGAGQLIAEGLIRDGHPLEDACGYDVFPEVADIRRPVLRLIHGDFCKSDSRADLVTLFDVAEHVPDTISFLKRIAERSDVVALHIPLDNSLVNTLFNRFRRRLAYPKHVLLLDLVSALNLVTLSGIMPIDYSFTFGYMASSGRITPLQHLSFPFRWAISHVSPWLASRTVGGVSLMVLGVTPSGLERFGA